MPEETGVIEVRIETPQGFVGLEWNLELVMSMASGDDIEQPWRLHGELDWDHWHSLSVLSAAFEDESILTFASLRPRNATGNDEDLVVALRARGDSEPAPLEDVLISSQRDAEGALMRVNLEASEGTGPGIVRAAGDVNTHQDAEPVERSFLQMRMAGATGFGTLDVLSRP